MLVDVLVVDGANVVGSVPDGWWADRAGAAARLHSSLVERHLPYDAVVLVLEGKARAGVDATVIDRVITDRVITDRVITDSVTTVHAKGSGDDEIVARCQEHADAGDVVTVVTADRGLLARLAPLGVGVLGPRTLRAQLDATP